MPTDATFRFSTYLALGLACLCLGYSEWDLLPEVTALTALVVVLLGVSYWMEGRYELNIRQANRMGVVIFVLAGAWLAWHYSRPKSLMHTLPWPAGLLPYLGPLLMVLMPAKLFRPKHEGDWWAMLGIGAVAVALACAMADDGAFAGLLAAYTLVAVWSAALFFHRRWAGAVPPVPGYPVEPPPAVVGDPGMGSGIRPVARWIAAAAVVALPLFFLTPRSPSPKWQLKARGEVGYTGETSVDMTTTGTLRVNRETAFEVYASFPDGTPKDDLSPETLWRGEGFSHYSEGKWDHPTSTSRGQMFSVRVSPLGRGPLADLGPGQFYLDYRPSSDLNRPVLAEPVLWSADRPSPVGNEAAGGRYRHWHPASDGSALPPGDGLFGVLSAARRLPPYRQVTRPLSEPDVGPGLEIPPVIAFRPVAGNPTPPQTAVKSDPLLPLRELKQLLGIQEWAQRLLADLIRDGHLPPDAAEFRPIEKLLTVKDSHYEAVAQAFQSYFATSGEFRYSLDLPRMDRSLDPVEDFLLNTKAGHCQRFASALALSLRGVGVPAILTIGFKGFDHEGRGRYVVRQDRAHAWVEVPVPRPAPPDLPIHPPMMGYEFGRSTHLWHMLSLDPSPTGDAGLQPTEEDRTWIAAAKTAGKTFYSDFIVGYDLERRNRVFSGMRDHFGDHGWWYVIAVVAVVAAGTGFAVVRRINRQVPGPAEDGGTGPGWYEAILTELAARGYPYRSGQTPGEYAVAAAAFLRADPRTRDVADVPVEAAKALYELRYAGHPVPADRETELHAAAARLAAVPGRESDRA